MIEANEEKFIAQWMKRAYEYAAKFSDDPDTKNGAVVVVRAFDKDDLSGLQGAAFGANLLPEGVERLPERMTRPLKYEYLEHAERDAIFRAVRLRIPLNGAVMVCPYIACKDCARAIAMTGITRIIGHKELMDMAPPRWQESIKIGNQILDDYKIQRDYWSGSVGLLHRFDGKDVAV